MISALDTNVLLDVLKLDPTYAAGSAQALRQAYDAGGLVLCEVVFAELAPQFETRESLESALGRLSVQVVPLDREVAYRSGRGWLAYRRAGGSRDRILPDFLIGAHAELRAQCLVTRDRGFYATYFPDLRIVDPSCP